MSKECTDRFDAGSRCRTGGRRMIRNRPDRTARGRISPRPGAATVRFAPQDTPPARIHSVRRTHTNEKPRRNSAGLLTDRSDIWRKRRDSNPRYPFEVYTLSRRAPSTARTLFPDRPLRRTRASGDQTCRKVRKFLKIKNTGGAFARSARTLSLAGRAVPSFPLRTGQHRRARPVPPSYSGSPFRCRCFRYRISTYADATSSPKKSERGRPARRSVPDKSSRGGPGPIPSTGSDSANAISRTKPLRADRSHAEFLFRRIFSMRTKRANRSGPVPFLQHALDRQKAGRASGFLSKGRLQGQSRVGNPEIDRSRVVLQQSIDPLAQLDFAPHAVHAGYQRIDETVGHILAAV